ncbi:MAG: GyrI-like domain-containing protein [Proteobacteria bacterium]|nr:GyrI-like domain-containing protein [Pseudomonadota bacterium]
MALRGRKLSIDMVRIVALLMAGFPGAFAQTSSPPAATPPAIEAPPPARTPENPFGEIREIEARPVLRVKGKSTWDDGFATMKKAFGVLEEEALRLGLQRAGNPHLHVIDTDDLGFTYEAMAPLAASPPEGTSFTREIEAVMSPAGRALVVPYEGAYDDIDSVYEALAAWLDDKNLVSTGKFLEEYEVVPEKSEDGAMRVKITVFLK